MVRYNSSSQELSRERVYKFYIQNKALGEKYTLDHFKAENIPKSTLYSIIELAEKVQAETLDQLHNRIAYCLKKLNWHLYRA